MKVLLHICCAPCAIEVIRDLRHSITCEIIGFFYNPNIHPASEFERRKDCLQYYIDNFEKIEVFYPQYNPREFFYGVPYQKDSPQRCHSCWSLRLRKTAQYAKENNISAFTTTLLISPHQDEEELNELGNSLAKEFHLEFISHEFKKFYSRGRKVAKSLGLYRQNYCGCLFSELERYKTVNSKQ